MATTHAAENGRHHQTARQVQGRTKARSTQGSPTKLALIIEQFAKTLVI